MPDCPFCAIAAGDLDAEVVLEEPGAVAFLDARPVFAGHTLVVPRRHHEALNDIDADGLLAVMSAVQRVAAAVEVALGAGGAWVSVNNKVSQSVPHLHVHVVPRTKGDGLRGFFWPRRRYEPGEAAGIASRLRDAMR